GAGGVADVAAFTKFGIGVGLGVRQSGLLLVACGASGRGRRSGAQKTLRSGHVILALREDHLGVVDVAHVALGGVADSAAGSHRRVADLAEVVMAAAGSPECGTRVCTPV